MVKQSIDEACELYNYVVGLAPDIVKDHGGIVTNFDGYFVHWDEVIKAASQAWKTPPGYSESPMELITDLIDQRDALLAACRGALAKMEAAWDDTGVCPEFDPEDLEPLRKAIAEAE
jgi:hypothetical protein